MGIFSLGIVTVSQLILRKIEKRNDINNNLLNYKEADEILLYLQYKNLPDEEFEKKKEKLKNTHKKEQIIETIIFMTIIFVTAFISGLLF